MTQPQRVLGFLDLFRAWDPTLIFVMAGAIGVHFWAYRWVRGRSSPLLAPRFEVPTMNGITPRLVLGSAIFGIGWGLGGYCPGPAVTALASGEPRPVAFVVFMLVGISIHSLSGSVLRAAPEPSGGS